MSEVKVRPTANLRDSRYEFALSALRALLPRLPALVVLDVGAGAGLVAAGVESLGVEWRGFDSTPASSDVRRWSIDEPNPAGAACAGAVLILDVIEHLTNPGMAIKNLHSALLPGGYLVLTTPNPRWSRSRLHALVRGVPACFTESDLDLNGHVFTAWPHILARMLKDAGFELEEYVTLDGRTTLPRGPFSLRYPLRLLFSLCNMLIERLDSSACGMTYAVIARKKV
ncbi:MAG: methyltransferase domain-containing protein [Thermoanaerobaculia bacterium]